MIFYKNNKLAIISQSWEDSITQSQYDKWDYDKNISFTVIPDDATVLTQEQYDKEIQKLQSINTYWLDITEISDKEYKAMLADNKAKSDKAQKEKTDAKAKILKRLGVSAEEFNLLIN